MSNLHPLEIVIVEKSGDLKNLSIKDFKLEEVYKKCGFKKGEDFIKQVEWKIKMNGTKYLIEVYAKTDGRPTSENKYDFPPPIDTKLFYGSCAIIGQIKQEDGSSTYTNLCVSLWEKMYEKLFGGFEDLDTTAKEDDEEDDDLINVSKEKKTKQGYLKDGFVVDSSDAETSGFEDCDTEENTNSENENDDDDDLDEVGSELSEE